jgi:ubiquinone/menaquinone biosynthesis C-methylase UbiE
MKNFCNIMKPFEGMKVLDLGGQAQIWDAVEVTLNITCLNLPGIANQDHPTHHNIVFVEGNACDIPDINYGDFDLVFSNSVIEHVGDENKQIQFCNEVKRVSKKYWIQTPHKNFPIEAHNGMPLWWYYPTWLRTYFLDNWEKKLPGWTKMIKSTTVITEKSLKEMLPNATIIKEWFLVFPKSLIAYSVEE